MKKLNLGCGNDIKKGYINLDRLNIKGVDVVHNLNKIPYPFKSNTFDEIVAMEVLMMVDDFPSVMEEIYRILKPGGKLIATAPHFTASAAFADPLNVRQFTYDSMRYFTKGFYYNFYFDFAFSDCKAKIIFGKKFSFWNYLIEPLANLFPSIYENSFLRVFPAVGIRYELIK